MRLWQEKNENGKRFWRYLKTDQHALYLTEEDIRNGEWSEWSTEIVPLGTEAKHFKKPGGFLSFLFENFI